MESSKSIYLFKMEVKPQCWEFVLIISLRNFHYTHYKAVLNDITKAYKDAGGDGRTLPKIPKSVGGEIDFMIGIKYFRYYLKIKFQLSSGLTIYESVFANTDGG